MITNNTEFWIFFYLNLADFILYADVLLKTYRVLCLLYIFLSQIPDINPYKWPSSFLRIITRPYFKFWEKLIPIITLPVIGVLNISDWVGFTVLGAILQLTFNARLLCLIKAHNLVAQLKG